LSVELSNKKKAPKLEPKGNGQGASIDWRQEFGRKGSDRREAVLSKLVTNDQDNPTKSRIPYVFGMVAMRIMGKWASASSKIEYIGDGKPKSLEKTVAGLEEFAFDQWNIISQSQEGKSREEYQAMGSSIFMMQHMGMDTNAEKKITSEGSRQK
jgi:hypothetical protein